MRPSALTAALNGSPALAAGHVCFDDDWAKVMVMAALASTSAKNRRIGRSWKMRAPFYTTRTAGAVSYREMIEKRLSKIHGSGVYATQRIPKNKRIIHYAGERISNQESLRRERRYIRNGQDRKSTRLNSSHLGISYAVFCLKKKKQQ